MQFWRSLYGLLFVVLHNLGSWFGAMAAMLLVFCGMAPGIGTVFAVCLILACVYGADWLLLRFGEKKQLISRAALCMAAPGELVIGLVYGVVFWALLISVVSDGSMKEVAFDMIMGVVWFSTFIVARIRLLWRAYRAERKRMGL